MCGSVRPVFAGIIGGAAYSGQYNWQGATCDMREAALLAEHFNMNISEQLRNWTKTHEVIEKHFDILEEIAEKLFKDKAVDDQFYESILLATKI